MILTNRSFVPQDDKLMLHITTKEIMPIEIKELHIKAVITNSEKQIDSAKTLSQDDINRLKKEITSEVTDKVLRILRQKSER